LAFLGASLVGTQAWGLPSAEAIEGAVRGVAVVGETCHAIAACFVSLVDGVDQVVLGFYDSHGPACSSFRGVGFAFLAVVGLVVVGLARLRLALERRRLDLVRRLVETGHEVPTELLRGSVRNDLRRGIVLVAAGIGVMATSWWSAGREMATMGLIPMFIGLGYLLSYHIAVKGDGGDGNLR
jgi:hypothetical protein